MITALVCAIILLVFIAATQWFMLTAAGEYTTNLEDLILEINDSTPGTTMPAELRALLSEEAEDIRWVRKEQDDD